MTREHWMEMWGAAKLIELELSTFPKWQQGPMVNEKRKMAVKYMEREVKRIKDLIQSEIGRME